MVCHANALNIIEVTGYNNDILIELWIGYTIFIYILSIAILATRFKIKNYN